jgi:hypothetical protein
MLVHSLQAFTYLPYCAGICPKGLRNTMKNLSQNSLFPSSDMNSRSPEYKEVQPRWSEAFGVTGTSKL